MARKFYIDTKAPSKDLAFIRGVNDRTPITDLGDLVVGDGEDFELYFVDGPAAAFESWSGDVTYTPRAAIGVPGDVPTGGTYTLTYGAHTTTALVYNADSTTVAAALNALGDVTTAGGVTVSGSFPVFLVTFNSVGNKTAISGTSAALSPDSTVTCLTEREGDGSTKERQEISIYRNELAKQEVWSAITNGYAASLSTNTNGVKSKLGSSRETSDTALEIEVTKPSGTKNSYAQAPIKLRGQVIGATTSPVTLPNAYTTVEADTLFVQNKYAVTGLTGGGSTNLDGVATVGVAVGKHLLVSIGGAGSFYRLVAGTDAESSPSVIRPDDYAAATNEKVWKLTTLNSSATAGYSAVTFSTAGNTDVAPAAAFILHTWVGTVSAGAGAYTRTISLLTANASPGSTIFLSFTMPASVNPTIDIRNASSGGTQLLNFTGLTVAVSVYAHFVYTGATWRLVNYEYVE